MADVTLLSSTLAQSAIIFVLVFTVVFAVLQKAGVFGAGKKQIDGLVALSVALLTVSVGYALDLIGKLAPFLAVGLVIILVFLILIGTVPGGESLTQTLKLDRAIGVGAFAAVIIAVLYFTDGIDRISSFFSGGSNLIGNAIFIVLIIVAIWFAVTFGTGDDGDSSKEKKKD